VSTMRNWEYGLVGVAAQLKYNIKRLEKKYKAITTV
jgi:hypothetical protein